MTAIPSWIPLVNLALLVWLVLWSIITERRMWYMKGALERKLLDELTKLRGQVMSNCEDLGQMRCTIRDTIAKVDGLIATRGGEAGLLPGS